MGIVKAPSISHYWISDPFLKINAIPSTMSRNRFELFLRMWHFSDSELQPEDDGLHKLTNVVDYLVSKLKIVYSRRNRVHRRNSCTIRRMFGNEAILPHENPQVMIVADNYYTSVDLASKLLDKSTNLLGTLKTNRKYNPNTVVNENLKGASL
ncbi:hypothetical protein PR048_025544 [Dryococelus australis]|uniref:PiggyBac transposable element-derived protein domain-containing protein n=1 Tax=Dryococelus australis TaxID=614101 RepID=A0ABQ9GRP3_9NEOP|nr:hypothetical protein PR048_025544 [Dryococelus australis]